MKQVKTRNDIREVRIVNPGVGRNYFLLRRYTFNVKPTLVDFMPYYELYLLCRKKRVQDLGRMRKNEMCESINIKMRPQTKFMNRKRETPVPVHTCAEKPREIEPCCLRRLRCTARVGGVRGWGSMNTKQLCTALNIEFKK